MTDDRSSEAGIRERAQAFRERRERIATAVLAGFAADPKFYGDAEDAACMAELWADALIARMDIQEAE